MRTQGIDHYRGFGTSSIAGLHLLLRAFVCTMAQMKGKNNHHRGKPRAGAGKEKI